VATQGQLPRRADVVEHGASRLGLWLQERRVRIALWIAVLEGLRDPDDRVAAVEQDFRALFFAQADQ